MTVQVPETLLYQGEESGMSGAPLSDYFAMGGFEPRFAPSTSMLWRGYEGRWEIIDHRLRTGPSFRSNRHPRWDLGESSSMRAHFQLFGTVKGQCFGALGGRALGFRISPAFTSRAFSTAIRFNNSDAGSSFGSCSTSFPRTARSSTNRRKRGMTSGHPPRVRRGRAVFQGSSGASAGRNRTRWGSRMARCPGSRTTMSCIRRNRWSNATMSAAVLVSLHLSTKRPGEPSAG